MKSLLAFIFCLFVNQALANIVVRDDDGHQLSLQKPAQRVISLAPHITELLFAAGGSEHVVGVSAYSDFPEAASRIPVVGDSRALDVEKIITLRPDLIVVWRQGTSARQIAQLIKLGIPIYFNDAHRLEDIPKGILILGQLLGTELKAKIAATDFLAQLNAISKRYANLPRVRLFYQVWDKPLYTLSGEHIVNDAIHVCGGDNIFASQKAIAPSVSVEAVLKENPDAIVATSSVSLWEKYPAMKAVKFGNLFVMDENLLGRAGPRMILGVAALCEKVNQAR